LQGGVHVILIGAGVIDAGAAGSYFGAKIGEASYYGITQSNIISRFRKSIDEKYNSVFGPPKTYVGGQDKL